ncbi:hypothetical protein BBW65_06235 [Helicobacter enhydrae]|uniref:Calcineurin-like phosphoesterase domain-containing protein n=1 Tax=Helicobacter enhydrae TaxID=222136 RepID=A0A1B1U6J2_9HELI|nr:metallophosphoesterase [Helicobacter enhydrae]ANV98417.1 hypothetical protein BBW65_06235 [Helicobacter enhydrae]
MCLELKPDAIFVADSHYNPINATILIDFLASLLPSPPSQLILMGDITQLLIGAVKSSVESHTTLLNALNDLEACGVEIIWLEGNHDFSLNNLKSCDLLKNTLFIPRHQQPLLATFQNHYYLLAHGDLFLGPQYECYTFFLRKSTLLYRFLDFLTDGTLYSDIESKLTNKQIRNYHDERFYVFAERRIKAYQKTLSQQSDKISGIIEGHFHIGKKIKLSNLLYIALPAFYFTQTGNPISKLLK